MAFERGYQFNFQIINRGDLSDTKVSLLCLDANVFVIVIALAVFKSESGLMRFNGVYVGYVIDIYIGWG